MRLELFDPVRMIHMRSDVAASEQPATPLGHSEGRWEGNALVIRTTRISWPYFDNIGSITQSETVEVVEGITLGQGETQLIYEITVDDPVTFTEPVSARWVLGWRPDLVVEPYECVAEG